MPDFYTPTTQPYMRILPDGQITGSISTITVDIPGNMCDTIDITIKSGDKNES